jgi:Glycosyltransferase family 87
MQILKSEKERRIAIVTIMLISAFYLLIQCVRYIPRTTHGFAAYYGYARLLLDEKDFSKTYNYEYFNYRLRSYGLVDDLPNNIPTNAFIVLPIVWMSAKSARIFFIAGSILLLCLSIILLFRLHRISLESDMCFALLAIILFFHPILANIALGQLYFILLFLFIVSLYGVTTKNVWLTAIPTALSLILKGYGIVPLIWFGWTKRWKEFFLTITVVAVAIFATLPLFKLDTWTIYYEKVIRTLGRLPSDGHVAYQCVNGFMTHLFIYDQQWHPFPLFSLSERTVFLIGVSLSILVILFVFRNRPANDHQTAMSFSAAVAAGVVTAPLAEEYHFVLFLPLAISLFSCMFSKNREPLRFGLIELATIGGILLLTLPLPYKSLQYSRAPLILLAYPKLYGGLLILFGYARFQKRNGLNKLAPSIPMGENTH